MGAGTRSAERISVDQAIRTVDIASFRRTIMAYEARNRRSMPWRAPPLRPRKDRSIDPYAVVVSEIMLQQTQVSRVMEKYPLFMSAFPDFASLARAPVAKVLGVWSGLGYNRRAVFLKRLSKTVTRDYGGDVPRDPVVLATLPGIGAATAGSICAFAFDIPVAFIETNIRRVFIHFFFPHKRRVRDQDIMPLVREACPKQGVRSWYCALMDYGAMLATKVENPNRNSAQYTKQKRFVGSSRELRGLIIKILLSRRAASFSLLARETGERAARVKEVVASLERDRMVLCAGRLVRLISF